MAFFHTHQNHIFETLWRPLRLLLLSGYSLFLGFHPLYSHENNPTESIPSSALPGNSLTSAPTGALILATWLKTEPDILRWKIQCLGEMRHIKENATGGFGINTQSGKNAWSAGYIFHGFHLYHRQEAALAYARNIIPSLSVATQLSYTVSSPIEDRERHQGIQLELAGIYYLKNFSLYFSYSHEIPLFQKEQKSWNQAVILEMGSTYHKNRFFLEALLKKDIREPLGAIVGIGYHIVSPIYVFTQAGANPVFFRLGSSFQWKNMELELSFAYHSPLGLESRFKLAWNFKTGKNGRQR